MDKKAIMGIVFTVIGVAGGVMLATFVSAKMQKKATISK
tara:strand:- start:13089 stop:13205 length:117 start_codon:yes stop_codon:yes gene_type:complete